MKYLLFLFSITFHGQVLHHQMLSSQGGFATTSKGIKVSQTVAQQGAIGTFSSKNGILSQGFQQSKISNSIPLQTEFISTLVYPNPIFDTVNFKLSRTVVGKIEVSIFDTNGRLVFSQKKEQVDNTITITNLMLAAGEYFVKLDGNRYSFSTIILKSK